MVVTNIITAVKAARVEVPVIITTVVKAERVA